MTAVELHNEAMELAEQALAAGREGDAAREQDLLEQAFEREKEAALSLLDHDDAEPSRSVLFRSAAALARDAGRYVEAVNMVEHGLSGTPPKGIRDELKALTQDILDELRSMKAASEPSGGDSEQFKNARTRALKLKRRKTSP